MFLLAIAGPASAITLVDTGTDSCSVPNTVKDNGQEGNDGSIFTLTPSSGAECYSGNDTGNFGITDVTTILGDTGWLLGDSTDTGTTPPTTSPVSFGTAPTTGSVSGTWSLNAEDILEEFDVLLSLKSGSAFGIFRITDDEGGWNITKFSDEETGRALSHATLWYKRGDVVTAPVPLPAGMWFLLGGMGALGVACRARRRA